MAEETIRVDQLLQEVGKSLLEAQSRIDAEALARPPGPEGLRTGVSISESEIEVKMVFAEDETGVRIRPVTAGKARLADLDPGVLSSLRARLVAVPDEAPRPPVRKPDDIRKEVLSRPDVARLAKIFGELRVETTYVPSARRWLVDVIEPSGQTLRSVQVEDSIRK